MIGTLVAIYSYPPIRGTNLGGTKLPVQASPTTPHRWSVSSGCPLLVMQLSAATAPWPDRPMLQPDEIYTLIFSYWREKKDTEPAAGHHEIGKIQSYKI